MNARLITVPFLSLLVAGSVAAHPAEDGFADLPAASGKAVAPESASALLRECLARLPAEPVRLSGWVRNRRPRGIVDREFVFEALLRWGDPVPTVRYDFMEGDGGQALARATFRRDASATEFILQEGAGLEPAATPAWNAGILGTDVTWLDLSMDFLRWPRAELAGEATVKGRLCDIVEVHPPQPIPGCLKVRIWIDREIRMFLQAQQVDEERAVARQMWVRSVKKMQGRWMVQDIEVEARGSGHRTRLHVTSCE